MREVRALTLKPIIGFLATPLVAPADPSSASVAASRIIVAASSYYWHWRHRSGASSAPPRARAASCQIVELLAAAV